MKKVATEIDDALYSKVKRAAQEDGLKLVAIFRQALEMWLDRRREAKKAA